MDWLPALDLTLFRFVNQTLANPAFDWLMPLLSGHRLFVPALLLLAALLIWRGGLRGRVCVAMLFLAVVLGDTLICATLKTAVARPRPFVDLPDARALIGKGLSGSMPSSHAANWFAGAMVAFIYYRRRALGVLAFGAAVAFSRVYNGVHYPSDVVAGAVLGAGYAAALVWGGDQLWRWLGQKWFPLWWRRFPSLLIPEAVAPAAAPTNATDSEALRDTHWLRLGYLLAFALLAVRLAYLASGRIELSEDEAYQWHWSKHLALSYYSKPPMIAYTQFLGTALWGDNAFGVRFFSPIIAAILSLLLLRFVARELNGRAAFCLVAAMSVTPLMAVGATLMTIDPLSVLFWTAALLAGWRAMERDSLALWAWTGVWLGLGFLSKYTELFQLVCWAVFFALWPPARRHLRKPGPWLALAINLLALVPVYLWNRDHGWATAVHLQDRAGLSSEWKFTFRYFNDFVTSELLLLNPVFLVASLWAGVAFWRRFRDRPLWLYLFSMGFPLFLGYWLYSFRARVQPNWIAPAMLPMFLLMVFYWESRWRSGCRPVKAWLIAGLLVTLPIVVLIHESKLAQKVAGRPLPEPIDPITRVRGWSEMARLVGVEREKLQAEGQPVFIVGAHYGITSLISFYLPESRAAVPTRPFVYFQSTDQPDNQFYFWENYAQRKGQNAIYARLMRINSPDSPPPDRLRAEFGSITDLGRREVFDQGRVIHAIQLFACRDLR